MEVLSVLKVVRHNAALCFILLGFLFLPIMPATAATLTVGPGQAYETIQAAVDAASDGDTINVKAGTYAEMVDIVTPNLVLRSVDGEKAAIVEGDGSDYCFYVEDGAPVTLDGFWIKPHGNTGIRLGYDNGVVDAVVAITNNTVESSDYGLYCSASYVTTSQVSITGNTAREASNAGFYWYGFDGCTVNISNNICIDCTDTGMDLEEFDEGLGADIRIEGNTVTLSEGLTGNCGITICCAERTTVLSGNTVGAGYEYGIYIEDTGCCGQDGLIFAVTDNKVTSCDYGIYFDELVCCIPGDVTITGNTLTGNDYGLYVSTFEYADESNALIENNNLAGNITAGFYNDCGEDLVADDNWWGDASGPSGTSFEGSGDQADGGNIIVSSWLSSPYTTGDTGSGDGCNVTTLAVPAALILAPALFLLGKKR